MANSRQSPRRPARADRTPTQAGRRPLPLQIAAIGVAAVGAWLLFVRTVGPGTIPDAAVAAAAGAGCDDLERPVQPQPSRDHLASGATFDYPDPPPAAGPHDPSPLPAEPAVHEAPVSTTRAVHNLEHADVLIWYRPGGDGGLSADVVEVLRAFADNERGVIMAPFPDLPEGRALALVAWNTRWLCPAGLTGETATTIAQAFVDAYRGTTNAPEAPRGLFGPMFAP